MIKAAPVKERAKIKPQNTVKKIGAPENRCPFFNPKPLKNYLYIRKNRANGCLTTMFFLF